MISRRLAKADGMAASFVGRGNEHHFGQVQLAHPGSGRQTRGFAPGSNTSSNAADGSPRFVAAELVQFVEHEYRIVGATFFDALGNTAGHGADVCFAMTANFRFVTHATQCHAHHLAAQSIGHRLCQKTFYPRPAAPPSTTPNLSCRL